MAVLKRSKFMMNRKSKHPSIVFEDHGKEYGYVSITHSKYFKGTKNIKLPENLEKGKTDISYILPNPRKDKKRMFYKTNKKMRIGSKNRYWIDKVKKNPYK